MKYDNTIGNVQIHIDTSRIDKNLKEAQKLLNMQVVADTDQYIPFGQGALRNSVKYPEGIYGGEILYDSPYAFYQNRGELYLAENGSSWAKYGEKKYPSGKELQYHTPGTGKEFFETSKSNHCKEWIDLVGKTIGKE